jgi:hypothetical protein
MVKISAREKLWKRRQAEKSKTDFPALLGNPANTSRDSHFAHSFGCCCMHDEYLSNKRGHFYRATTVSALYLDYALEMREAAAPQDMGDGQPRGIQHFFVP